MEFVVLAFFKELRSNNVYEVEKLLDGQIIELRRPANLNKGFDSTIHIPGINFGKNRNSDLPTHNSILNDLRNKKIGNPRNYKNSASNR
jgi:hypothetical protein